MFCKIQSVHISGHMNKYMSLLELLLRVTTVTAVQHFREPKGQLSLSFDAVIWEPSGMHERASAGPTRVQARGRARKA